MVKMGKDCMMVTELQVTDNFWYCIGAITLGRDYSLFDAIEAMAIKGFPEKMNNDSEEILKACEEYGECWMPYNDWLRLVDKYDIRFGDVIKKKYRDKCRVIFRFDW